MADFELARSCEMTISRADFFRLLPGAVADVPYEVRGCDVVHGDTGRGWRIRLEPMPDLELGLIRLSRQRVGFAFAGHTSEEIEAFFRRFDLYFARAGG